MAEYQEKRKLWYDRNAVFRKFKVGDQVYVLDTFKRNKMAVNWFGPGSVTDVISQTNYPIYIKEKKNVYYLSCKTYEGIPSQA